MTATRESILEDIASLYKIIKGNNISIVKIMLKMDNIDIYMKDKHKIGLPLDDDKAILNSLSILQGCFPNIDQSSLNEVITQGPITTVKKFGHNLEIVADYTEKIRQALQN